MGQHRGSHCVYHCGFGENIVVNKYGVLHEPDPLRSQKLKGGSRVKNILPENSLISDYMADGFV